MAVFIRYVNNSHIYLQNGVENRPPILTVPLTFLLLEHFVCSALLTPRVDSFLFLLNWITYQSEFYKKNVIQRASLWALNDDEFLCRVTKEEPQELWIRLVRPAVRSSDLVLTRIHLSFKLNNDWDRFPKSVFIGPAQETRRESEGSRFVGAYKRSRCVRENFRKREKFLTWDVKGKGIF